MKYFIFLRCNGLVYEQVCLAEMFKFSTNVIGKLAYMCGYAQAIINQKLTKIWKQNYFTE